MKTLFRATEMLEKAGAVAGVAGGTGRVDLDEEGVRVAVRENFLDLLHVAASPA